MDLAGMEIFARVVEARSFSAAARRMNVSTSAVSKCVTRMEQSLGTRLLNRTTRSISLTEIGTAFYARCAHIVAAAEEAEAMAAGLQSEPRGTLKVNVPVSFGVLHIVPALDHLLAACPELRVDMTLNDGNLHLVPEGYDVAVLIAREPHASLVARKLAPIRQRLCATADYLRRRGVPSSPADLARHNCIVYSRLGPERCWRFTGRDGEVTVEVNGSLRLDNENAVRQAALAGIGIAFLPTYIASAPIYSKTGCSPCCGLRRTGNRAVRDVSAEPLSRGESPRLRRFSGRAIRAGTAMGCAATDGDAREWRRIGRAAATSGAAR